MEKLQVAIEQARQRRAGATDTQTAKSAHPKTGAPQKDRKRPGPRLLPDGLIDRWDALAKLKLPSKPVDNRRLVAHTPGLEAAHYDVLRTKLLIELRRNGWRRVAITSPTSGCGKTTTSANLALSLSRQGDLRTALFDFDLRRPAIASIFGHTPKEDITSFLSQARGFGDVAVAYNSNLAIAMAGSSQSDPTQMMAGEHVSELLDQVDKEFAPDVMIFDLPPLLAGDDARAFLRHVDCALLMAQAGVTTAQQIDVSEREMAEQTNVLGVVLNRCLFEENKSNSSGYGY